MAKGGAGGVEHSGSGIRRYILRDIDHVRPGYCQCVLWELEVRCTLAFGTQGRGGATVDIYGYRS